MAYNNIVLNSRFQPFSYQEMLHPVQMATQGHQQLEAEMGDLSSKAGAIAAMANQETDPESYAKYMNYSNQLKQQAQYLGSQGLQQDSRRGLMDMRDRFATDIMPIAQAHAKREQLAMAVMQAKLQDPTLIVDIDPSSISLDKLVKDPSFQPQTHRGSVLTTQAIQAFSNLAKQMSDDPEQIKSVLGGQYYEILKKGRFNTHDIMEALMNSENAAPELIKIQQDILNASGISNWNNPDATQKALDAINQGMWSALGIDQSSIHANQNYGRVASGGAGTRGDNDTDKDGLRVLVHSSTIKNATEIKDINKKVDDFENHGEINYQRIQELEERIKRNDYERRAVRSLDPTISSGAMYTGENRGSSRKQDQEAINKIRKQNNEFLKSIGVDPNDSRDNILKGLKAHQNKQTILYSKFNMMGAEGAYDNFASVISGEAARRNADRRGSEKGTLEYDILNSKGKAVNTTEFAENIEKGVTSVIFNRNNLDPRLSVSTKGGVTYDIHASLLPDLHRDLQNLEAEYETLQREYAGRPEFEELFNKAMENYDVRQFNIVRQRIFQGYHQSVGPTGKENL